MQWNRTIVEDDHAVLGNGQQTGVYCALYTTVQTILTIVEDDHAVLGNGQQTGVYCALYTTVQTILLQDTFSRNAYPQSALISHQAAYMEHTSSYVGCYLSNEVKPW
jgi:hypothetical protein